MEFFLVRLSCLRGGSRKSFITVFDIIGNRNSSVTLRIPRFIEYCLLSFTNKLIKLDRRQKYLINQKCSQFSRPIEPGFRLIETTYSREKDVVASIRNDS